jgi:hypothetical protein
MNSSCRTVQQLCRLTSAQSTTLSRSFATYRVDPGHRYPDGLYRRPQVPPPTKPISEYSDLVFYDGQAPQLTLDYDPLVTGWEAFKGIVGSISVTLLLFYGGSCLLDHEAPTVRGPMPYDNLKSARGGPSDLAIQQRKAYYEKFDTTGSH